MFMVGVHNIALAEQSSSILALHDGVMRDTRCCCRLHLERPQCQTGTCCCLASTQLGYSCCVPMFAKVPKDRRECKKVTARNIFLFLLWQTYQEFLCEVINSQKLCHQLIHQSIKIAFRLEIQY